MREFKISIPVKIQQTGNRYVSDETLDFVIAANTVEDAINELMSVITIAAEKQSLFGSKVGRIAR